MTLTELITKLQRWEKTFSGDLPVDLHVITNEPIVSKGRIIDIYFDVDRKKGVEKIIIFGGKRK